ncbi:MAG: thioredoxin domain-containing protein [Anaerolinea sp.]|nr:thioredoxin domain-containing protein [Anaerolinea sp.]
MPTSSKTQATAKPASSKRGKGKNREALILLMIGIPVVIVGILLASLYNREQSSLVVDDTRLIRPDSPTLGSLTAPVTIVEFLDPECESCRAAFPFVKQLLEEYDERVRLVVRYFPLHNNSVLAATVTEAAGAQGMYWEMQEMLFTRQSEWGEQRTPQTDLFISYATELGLNIEQFTADLQNPDYLARIERDQADGEALGVTGTPTFFINGRLVEELSADAIIAMIEEELAR